MAAAQGLWFMKYRRKINDNSVLAGNGSCILWSGYRRRMKGGSVYGEVRAKLPGMASKKYGVHRLQYILYHLDDLNPKGDVSHLCHNSVCVSLDHLSLEDSSINKNRQICLAQGRCQGHGDFRNCMLELYLGKHAFKIPLPLVIILIALAGVSSH